MPRWNGCFSLPTRPHHLRIFRTSVPRTAKLKPLCTIPPLALQLGLVMNSFYEHHKDSIRWHYRRFDRILLNGSIQPFQQPERVVGFFNTYPQPYPVTRQVLRDITEQFQRWVKERAAKRNIPIVEAPKGRRDEFVDPYFARAKPDQVAVILKAREPARIMIAIGDKAANRWHLQIADRWVSQYNFSINDRNWGRIFVRICPCLLFSARVCLSQHHWLANRMREHGIEFKQVANAFLKCAAPDRLQELADSLTPRDLVTCGQKWLARLTPFFTASERERAGCQHRLFFSQVEFCDNIIFRRRSALDVLGEPPLDANRAIGQPDKITVIFGRKVTKHHRGKLQTEIEDMHLPNPVILSHYGNGFIKQYVRDHLVLRTEAASNNVVDYGVNKAVENLSALRNSATLCRRSTTTTSMSNRTFLRPSSIAVSYENSRNRQLPQREADSRPEARQPAATCLDARPRRFAHIAAANTFTPPPRDRGSRVSPRTLHAHLPPLPPLKTPGQRPDHQAPQSRRYQLRPQGYSISLVFLKLFERIYAPLTAGLLSAIRADARLDEKRRSQLVRLYQRVVDDLDALVRAIGLNLKAA